MMEGEALVAVQGARKRLRTTLVGRKKEVSVEDMAAREAVEVVALDYLYSPPKLGLSPGVCIGLAGGYLRPLGPRGSVVTG